MASVIGDGEAITENPAATNLVDGVPAHPPAAAQFTADIFVMSGDGVIDGLAQIEVTTDAFRIGAIDAQQRTGVLKVEGEFDLAEPGQSRRIILVKIQAEGLDLREYVGEQG